MRRCSPIAVLVLAACGGGGGGGDAGPPPSSASAQFAANDVTIASAAATADLTLALASSPSPAPTLFEAHVELPAQLQIATQDRLAAIAPVSVDGDFHGGRFVVLCGDTTTPDAQGLPVGDLFRLRLQPTPPRQPGSYTVTLRNLRAATSAGAEVPLAADTLALTVTVQ